MHLNIFLFFACVNLIYFSASSYARVNSLEEEGHEDGAISASAIEAEIAAFTNNGNSFQSDSNMLLAEHTDSGHESDPEDENAP